MHPERPFHQDERRLGEDQGHRHPEHEPPRLGDVDPWSVDQHEHRPVEQVHAVADPTEPGERRPRQHTHRGRRHLQPDDEGGTHEADQRQAAVERGTVTARERGHAHRQGTQRDRCPPAGPSREGAAAYPERDQRADEDLAGTCRRGPVRRVGSPHRSDERCCHAERRGHHTQDPRSRPMRARQPAQPDERERPDPVELLLDRE